MTAYMFVVIVCGFVATFFLTWVFVALVGLIFVPVSILVMAWLGTPLLSAIGQAMLGYAALQVSFGLSGWAVDWFGGWHNRSGRDADQMDLRAFSNGAGSAKAESMEAKRGSADIHASNMPASLSDSMTEPVRATVPRLRFVRRGHERGASETSPLFGGWLPLAAFYDPPSHADGSPWDGVHDPGYRVTILVFGWLNRAASVRVGSPKPCRSILSQRERDRVVAAMDERVRRSRARSSDANDESPPEVH